jgi:hypothetical protein
MSEISNSSINYHTYNVHEGDTLITQVSRVVVILLPRGMAVCGYSEQGDLLMIRYGDYDKSLPVWILDFYEHRFIDEPLLAKPEMVVATFIASDKYMVIPETMYDEGAAVKWLHKLFFIESNEVLTAHRLHEDKAKYMFAWPGTMKSLIGRYFTNSKVLPLASYQFYKPYKADSAVQCCITSEQVYATLYKNRTLHWHQVFNYENAEDIAYQLRLLCRQQKVNPDNLDLQCSVTFPGLNPILNELGQFFPNMKGMDSTAGAMSSQWSPSINLLQQLYACAL